MVGSESDVGLLLSVRSGYPQEKSMDISADAASNEEGAKTHRIKVLIFKASTSYNFLTASLICLLLLFKSTMNTNVLFSSIFFMAVSVFKGCWMVLNWSILGKWLTDLRGYRGDRARARVLGRWNETEVRTLRTEVELVPFKAAFLAALALTSAGLPAAATTCTKGQDQLTSCVCARTGAQGDEWGVGGRGDARRGNAQDDGDETGSSKTTRTRTIGARGAGKRVRVRVCVCAFVAVCLRVRVRADGRIELSTLTRFQSFFHPLIIVAHNRPRCLGRTAKCVSSLFLEDLLHDPLDILSPAA